MASVSHTFSSESHLMPFWMPLTVEVANTAVSSTTTRDCMPAVSLSHGSFPAALLS